MADASSGVSGSDSSQNAQNAADRAAETAAAQQAAADKAAADAVAAAAVDPVQAAPVDLSLSPATLSQLSAMPVDVANPSFNTLGGVPTATYADVAQAAAPAPAVEEYNAWSPTFSITPNDPAAVANATIADVTVNLGLKYDGPVTSSFDARFGLDPAQISFDANLGYTNGLNSYGLSFSAGPFGGPAQPSYSAAATANIDFSDIGTFDFNANAAFNGLGFQNGSVSMGVTRSFSENLSGYTRGTASFDADGLSNLAAEGGVNLNYNGLNAGFVSRGSFDVRTGDATGYFGVRAGGKF